MEKNKILLFSILILLILNTILIIYLANFRCYVFNENYYKKQFEENDVYSSLPDADKELNNLLLFFKGKEKLNNFFSQNEKEHLQDVKVLINKVIIIFYISVFLEIFLISLLYARYKKGFLKNIKFIFLCSGGITLLTSILIYFFSDNFDYIFIKFHEIFFQQGNWLFPASSNLIKLFPHQFFYAFFHKIIINSAIASPIIFAFGLLLFLGEK